MNYSMVTSGKSPERVESWLRCEPIIARTATIHQPMAPAAYDCVKLVVVRDGSALLLSEFGQRFVTVGDVVVLNANVLCVSEPECQITTTTIYLDTDYVIVQVYRHNSCWLYDRFDGVLFAI